MKKNRFKWKYNVVNFLFYAYIGAMLSRAVIDSKNIINEFADLVGVLLSYFIIFLLKLLIVNKMKSVDEKKIKKAIEKYKEKTSDELIQIINTEKNKKYSEYTYEAVERILSERGVNIVIV